MLKKIILIGCLSLIASCGYFKKIIYYEPERSSSIFVSEGSRGPVEITKFGTIKDIDMYLIIFHNSNAPYIRCWWRLSRDSEMKFFGSEIILTSPDGSIENKVLISKIRANYIENDVGSSKSFDPQDLLIGETYLLKSPFGREVEFNPPFEIEVPIKGTLPEKFNLKMPLFDLNGEKIDLPVINYTKKEGTYYQFVRF